MRNTTLTTLVVSASLAGAGPLHAQGGDTTRTHPHMEHRWMHTMMPMMGACPMMAATAHGPATALDHAEALALTETQRQRLQALRDAMEQAHDVLTPEQRAKLRELHMHQATERMMRMMHMMSRFMDMMERDSAMHMRGMQPGH